MTKFTDEEIKEINELAKAFGESVSYIEKIIKEGGKNAGTVYAERFLVEKALTGVAPNEEPPAPLTKKDVRELSKGYGFFKGDVIRLAREEAAAGKEPTREYMEAFLDEIVVDVARRCEEEEKEG